MIHCVRLVSRHSFKSDSQIPLSVTIRISPIFPATATSELFMSQLSDPKMNKAENIRAYAFIGNTLGNKIAKMMQSLFHSDFLTDT